MRKIIYMLITAVSLTLFSEQTYAQRRSSGMRGVKLRDGFTEGLKSPLNHYAGFTISGYTKEASRRVVGAEYLLRDYEYCSVSVPRTRFTAEGGYYLKFLSDSSKTLFLSIGGPALAGYETANWGNKMSYNGSKLLTKDTFIYGGAITLGLEIYVTDRIMLLANVRERIVWGGSLSVFTMQFGLGVKFIIN